MAKSASNKKPVSGVRRLNDLIDDSAYISSNRCLNSLAGLPDDKRKRVSSNGYSIEARVYHVIDASEVELKPSEIARIIHSDKKPKQITAGEYTTVRVACAKLLQKGQVVQPYPGAYCNKITHGVRFVPLCVHNVTLFAKVCQNLKHWAVDEFVGGVKLHVCFGKERKKITGYIACDVGGMSHDACLLALNRWFEIVEGKLGYCLQDLVLQTVEFNKDYHGARIDGFQCVTKHELYGIIDRTYQKESDVIRRERKVTQPMSLNKFEAEIHKNLEAIGKSQEQFELQRKVDQNTEALKFTNSRILEVEKLAGAIYQHMAKLPKIDGASAEKLNARLDKLNEVLGRLGELEQNSRPSSLGEGQTKMKEYLS